jgi:hypothetical protein
MEGIIQYKKSSISIALITICIGEKFVTRYYWKQNEDEWEQRYVFVANNSASFTDITDKVVSELDKLLIAQHPFIINTIKFFYMPNGCIELKILD